MTRQIAFSHTARQLLRGEKTVTRRLGWRSLSPGDTLVAVTNHSVSARVLGTIVVVSAWRERLDAIKQDDCVREGFPDLSPERFVEMFCATMGCAPNTYITRIEFRFTPFQLDLFGAGQSTGER